MKNREATVQAIAIRAQKGEPMVETIQRRAVVGKGLVGQGGAKGQRGITLISADKWFDATRELDHILPWHARRANILVQGIDLESTVGKCIRVGEVNLRIWEETKPCALMDKIYPGLRKVLEKDFRGGVLAEVLSEGTIRVGDPITVLDKSPTPSCDR
jgi:MOSC domain-containing protein YiiM